MPIKKSIYPKTKRFVVTNAPRFEITEKLNGENLVIFKLNEKIYIAQRNNIFTEDEISDANYKGLKGWLELHLKELQNGLYEGSAICGEWLSNHKINSANYDERLPLMFYQFAKANVNEKLELYNISYYHEFFKYNWINETRPDFIGEVPIVISTEEPYGIDDLNNLYKDYSNGYKAKIEGFVINYMNNITKYVRLKNGKLEEHHD